MLLELFFFAIFRKSRLFEIEYFRRGLNAPKKFDPDACWVQCTLSAETRMLMGQIVNVFVILMKIDYS